MAKKSTVTTDSIRVLVSLTPELAAKVDGSRGAKSRPMEIFERLAKSYGMKGATPRGRGNKTGKAKRAK